MQPELPIQSDREHCSTIPGIPADMTTHHRTLPAIWAILTILLLGILLVSIVHGEMMTFSQENLPRYIHETIPNHDTPLPTLVLQSLTEYRSPSRNHPHGGIIVRFNAWSSESPYPVVPHVTVSLTVQEADGPKGSYAGTGKTPRHPEMMPPLIFSTGISGYGEWTWYWDREKPKQKFLCSWTGKKTGYLSGSSHTEWQVPE